MRGVFIGSGGVRKINLPQLLHDKFSYSLKECRRAVDDGEVRIDGEVVHAVDIELERVAGSELQIRSEIVEVEAA